MNRLVIVGNGFDLAHGLKTSYKDFMLDYLISALELVRSKGRYEDDVMIINIRTRQEVINISGVIEWIRTNVNALRNLLNGERYIFNDGGAGRCFNNLEITFKNKFIERLFQSSNEKWVDIEEFYYRKLLESVKKERVDEEIDDLNAGMVFLRNKLKEYLLRIKINVSPPSVVISFARRCVESSLPNSPDREIGILNFNYTSLIYNYLDEINHRSLDHEKLTCINIHGSIGDSKNPIVFGYGDEMDSNYKLLEEANNNKLLNFAKSFSYFETNNYKDLERFVNAGLFDVFIMGHSCGLSDRVMLNMVFEHDKCESIKIFYHKRQDDSDNFTEITQNISRHFKDKRKMRHRIVSKEDSEPLQGLRLV